MFAKVTKFIISVANGIFCLTSLSKLHYINKSLRASNALVNGLHSINNFFFFFFFFKEIRPKGIGKRVDILFVIV